MGSLKATAACSGVPACCIDLEVEPPHLRHPLLVLGLDPTVSSDRQYCPLRIASLPWFRDLAGAWIFYSVLPAWPWLSPRFERIARFAPWIGLVIGGLQALLWFLLSAMNWSVESCALLAIALGTWLTGGLHVDGLMDTADGLAAGQERCLEAMDDSRVGASGVQALLLVVLLQAGALIRLGTWAPMALVMAAVIGRVAPLSAMARFPYLRQGGTAAFHRRHWRGVLDWVPAMILIVLLLLSAALRGGGLVLSVSLVLTVGLGAAWLLVERLGRRLGGHTGDTYGACLVWGETFTLLSSALLFPVLSGAG